jgi:hypothetical protein
LTKFTARIIALSVVAVMVGPAITECAGWSMSAAGRHVCCADRGLPAPETNIAACCGMSDTAGSPTPSETQAARPPVKSPGLPVVLLTDSSAARTPVPTESLRRAAVVPLYLRQASLLI